MKNLPVLKVIGVVILGVLVLAAIRYIDSTPSHRLLAVFGMSASSEKTVSPTPSPSPVATAADQSGQSLGIVAIQVFSGSSLVRSGSGSVISSDGLIVTTAYVVPVGSGSHVYQVATADGGLLRATVVWRHSGLVILQVPATDLRPVLFTEDARAGISGHAVGAFVSLSKYTPVIIPATLAYVGRQNDIGLSMEKTYSALLSGASFIDVSGRSLGLVQTGDYPRLVPSSVINAAVEQYLSNKK